MQFNCTACHKSLGLLYEEHVNFHPHLTRLNVFMMLLALIWLPFAVYSTMVFSTDLLKLTFNAIILFLVLGMLGFAGVNSLLAR